MGHDRKRIAVVRASPRNSAYRGLVPLFAPVLSSAWRHQGHEVLFLDRAVIEEEAFWSTLADYSPDVVAVSAMIDSFVDLLQVVARSEEVLPTARIVAGGPHVTELGAEVGELLGKTVAVCLGDGCSYDPIQATSVSLGLPQPLTPDWTDIQILDYHPVIPVQTAIGCANRCGYCSETNLFGTGIKSRAVDDVVQYLARCLSELRVHRFRFVDSTFSAPPSRFDRLCRALVETQLPVVWGAYVRWEQLSPERLELAWRAGCRSVFIGVETLDPSLASSLGRSSDAARLRGLVRTARGLGIAVHCSLIFGLPRDSPEGVRRTSEEILRVEPTTVKANPFKLGPASEYGRHPEAYGITILDPKWRLKQHRYSSDIEFYDDFRVAGFSTDEVFELVEDFEGLVTGRSRLLGHEPSVAASADWSLFEANNERSFSPVRGSGS